ncbi:nicotinate-nucleotide--dimethylbenzimidazole phosphoribosyltransferase [Streptomyces sp. NPDC046985]|uniref:nicotinate-nucleotide--dimethylbenzimidazole phosphoribosyltransferase n=1 Tax=Streptomyces sp. NPDC046985 TaxID=3155377 RepID=UPI003406F78F
MTDTGQVPGEGLPEGAGRVEQPGVPAHGSYTYLSESPAEDEELLLPGSHGAWGNEVPPPAPEPVLETVHQPGPHETAGRDTGSVDLTGVLHPDHAAEAVVPEAVVAAAAAAAPPRRPLHLGPVIPDASASPVRSLADRGPAGAPVRPSGPPAAGLDYLDVQQVPDTAPPGPASWGAQPPHDAALAAAAPDASAPALAPDAEAVAPEAVDADAVGAGSVGAGSVGPEAGAPDAVAGGAVASEAAASAPDALEAVAPEAFASGEAEPFGAAEATMARLTAQAGASGPAAAPEGDETRAGHPSAPAADGEQPESWRHAAQDDALVAPGVDPNGADTSTGFSVAPGLTAGAVHDVPNGPTFEAGYPSAAGTPTATPAVRPGVPADASPTAPAAATAPPAATVEEGIGADATATATGTVHLPAADVLAGAPAQDAVPAQGAGPAPTAAQGAETAVPTAETPAGPAPEAGQPAPLGTATGPAAPLPDAPAPAPLTEAPQGAAQFAEQGPVTAPAPGALPPRTLAAPEAAAVPVSEATHAAVPQPAPEAAPAPRDTASEAQGHQAAAPAHLTVHDGSALPAAGPESALDQMIAARATEPEDAFPHLAAQPEPPVTGPVGPPAGPAPAAGLAEGVPSQARPGMPSGRFAPAEGAVPTAPHPAPTPAHPLVLPTEQVQADHDLADQDVPEHAQQQPAAADAAHQTVAGVPAPRDGAEPEPATAQWRDDLDAQGAAPHAQRHQGDRIAEDDLSEEGPEGEEGGEGHEGAAPPVTARRPAGPAAPGYGDAEREAVLRVMRERRDVRNGFRPDPIPHEVLLRVLEAAHTAPSVGHSQPWDFVVIRSADTRRAMHELAERQRDAYAKSLPKGRAKQFKELKIEAILDTPVNIVVTADPTRGGRHTLGRHTQPQMAPYSAALAVENLWLAARAEGLGVGWVSFFDEREMVRALGLPEHLEVIAYLCVGYVDEFPDEPELVQAGWSKRRPLSWVVHEETYGHRALPGEAPHDLLAETIAQIRPLDAKALGEAWERQKRMTKPAGALGMLEIISAQLSGLSRQCPPPIPEPAAVAIFAGDHGVHAQGVTPWPQEVTAQMVANFLGGGAVCNAFAAQVGAEVCVVDVGVAADLPATPGLLPRKVRAGTSDMTAGAAMTREEVKKAVEVGIETARDLVAAGNKALLTGEMGIANTTASAALISVYTGADPAEVTGRGTGINDETLARKTEVVRRALALHQPDPADPLGVLAAVGGFEHAALVGLLLGGASLRTPVILDGVSAGAAALVARAIAPEVLAACIAGHRSAEPGHVAALNKLGLRPLVDLDLRLGEGTGALLALPLVQSTARAMHEVATFDSAGVTEK